MDFGQDKTGIVFRSTMCGFLFPLLFARIGANKFPPSGSRNGSEIMLAPTSSVSGYGGTRLGPHSRCDEMTTNYSHVT